MMIVYIVQTHESAWTFNGLNKAMDFVRTMMTAEGNINVQVCKIEADEGVETDG
jgi:hypothetical protein